MTHKEKRGNMDKAIKEFIVPFLRQKGFKGSFPHFRREQQNNLNLLTFQFSQRQEPEFIVEIGNCQSSGITTHWGKEIKPNKCNTSHLPVHSRLRLGAKDSESDYWFNYGKKVILSNVYKKTAQEVINLFNQAEDWWEHNSN